MWIPASAHRRLLCAAVGVAVLLPLGSGCSYLQWRRTKAEQRAELKKNPADLALEKDYAPQDCFGLYGRVAVPEGTPGPLLVAAFAHEAPHELVGSKEIVDETGYWGLLLPSGVYDVTFFADLNGDGFYESDELVGRTPAESPVFVGAKESPDGMLVPAPAVAIDLTRPGRVDAALHVRVVPLPFVVESVDDPLFAREMGEMGLYHPGEFLARTQSFF
ncbi:MAG: hypothetical protein ACM3NW_03080, partial [Syntrophomonadaceae bacterium]